MVRGGWDAVSRDDERMIEYVRQHKEIRDVIVSGGDPLTLPYSKLKYFLFSLRDIPHVDVIRLGTRVPTTSPLLIRLRIVRIGCSGAPRCCASTRRSPPSSGTTCATR